ncbi:MAG: response regulator [Candidatus Aminicenantes bacterium]|nr:response regulator [Candidatus Aminicenantes bacterium]
MNEKNYAGSILVVDDDPVIAELLAKMLEKPGHTVQIAEDAGEMFSIVESAPPDLIILDVMLPGANGFDLAVRLKEKEETRDIPIIFMTVKAEVKDKVKAFKLGVVDYLTKPIDLEEAAARINTHLTLRRLQKSLEEKNRRLRREISDRKQADEALRESEDRYRALFNYASDYIFIIDPTHKDGPAIVDVNEYACAKHGYTREELVGKPYSVIDDIDSQKDLTDKALRILGGEILNFESVHVCRDGSKFPVEVSARLIDIKTEPVMIAIVRDITKRRQAEEQVKASLKEKEMLLKEIHHRVKNNLQLINSFLSLQSRRLNDKESIALLKEVENRVNSIALIHEKMYCSESLGQIDFGEYIRDLTTHLFNSSPARISGVRLNLKMADLFLVIDKAIPCALIINELVTNSLKYAFPNGRKGEVSIELKTADSGKITLTAADDGIGLPAGFDMGKATTLGMQIVKALSKQVHGSVRVAKGSGTKFVLEFQVTKENGKEAKS